MMASFLGYKVNFTGIRGGFGVGSVWGSEAQNNHRSPGTSSAQARGQSQLSHSGGNWWFQGTWLLQILHLVSAAVEI